MFGSIGGPELVLIFLVALLIFGPRKLPELGKMLGKGLGEFRRAANDLRVSLETEVAREASTRPLPLPSAPAGSAAPGEPVSSGDASTSGADAAPDASVVPTPAPGSVSRPRLAAPGLPEAAADAEPAGPSTPDAPEADGREFEEPR
jgi:sec-independent protein translocase protein TatA